MAVTVAVTALDGLAFGLLLLVIAAGLTLIFGVLGILNLAHGSFYLAGASVAYLFTGGGLLGLAVALVVGAVLGAGGGIALGVVLRPLAGHGHLGQALATLGLAFLAADAYTSGLGGAPLPINPPDLLGGSITLGDHGYPTYRLVFIAIAAVLVLAMHMTITRSRYGVVLRAAVADPAMAAASGVNTRRVQALAMGVGGALAVTGGVLGAPLLGPAPGVDTTVLVLSLIVVVIGGPGSILGAFGAALLVGQVQTVGVLVAPTTAPFALLAVLLASLTIRHRAQPAPVPAS